MHLFRLNDTSSTAHFCLQNANIFASDLRLFLVGILGSLVSIISIGHNILLFYVFSTSRKLRRQNYVNPVMLAFFDIFVSAIYLLISPTHFLAHRLKSAALASFWSKNMRILYCLEHFALTVCNFLLVIASIERYLANSTRHSQRCILVFIVRHKPYVFAAILGFALLLKATLYFEIGLFKVPECANLAQSLIPVWLSDNPSASQSIRFWARNFLTVTLPFLVLAYCNFKIVQQLRKRRRMTLIGEYSGSLASQTHQNFAEKQSKANGIISPKIANQQSNSEPQGINRPPNESKWHPNVKLAEDGSAAIVRKMLGENGKLEDKRITFLKKTALPRERLTRQISKSESECPNRADQRPNGIQSTSSLLANSASMPNVGPASIPSPNSNFGVRIATRTLVMVVGCYLISNSMSTILNIWEYFDVKFLRHDNFHAYLIASDIAALLTICGCALRLPIYVSNDKRIRKAICRAFIRFRFGCTKTRGGQIARGEEAEQFLEKYSIVIVSNSLRSNLTGALSQLDWATFRGKRSFDQLAILVQNRRKFIVQMTINLGAVQELGKSSSKNEGENGEEECGDELSSTTNLEIGTMLGEDEVEETQRAVTSLTDVHEGTISEHCGGMDEEENIKNE